MKKFLLLLGIMALGSIASASDCETLYCSEPYNLTSGFSRFFSNVTGQNFLAEKIGESLTKRAIKKEITDGKIKVNLNSYSVRDLKAGKFKSLEITGKDVNFQGVYISYFNTKTICNFNYIVQEKDGNVIIKEDIPVAFKTEITEEDLNKTMNSSDYKRLLNDINSIGGNFNIFQITSTNVKLKNGKMYYVLKYTMPFMRKSQEVVISADLCVDRGKIILANTNLVNNNLSMDVNKFSRILNYINPLDFSAKILENKDARFNIENVKICDKKITVDGRMTVLKDKD